MAKYARQVKELSTCPHVDCLDTLAQKGGRLEAVRGKKGVIRIPLFCPNCERSWVLERPAEVVQAFVKMQEKLRKQLNQMDMERDLRRSLKELEDA